MKRTRLVRYTALLRRPLRRRSRFRLPDNPKYLEFIRTLCCACCRQTDAVQQTHTEAHHVRLYPSSRRPPDLRSIPLCAFHHRLSPESAHVLGRRFAEYHHIDIEGTIAWYNELYAMATGRSK